MSILGDLFTALKGGVSEVGEAVVDTQAIRIYEQNIREADEAIRAANKSLTSLKAKEIKLKRAVDELDSDIGDWESKAIEALDAGKEDLARKAAERIAESTERRDSLKGEWMSLESEVRSLNALIQKRKHALETNRRELDKVKTTDQIQKATRKISSNIAATSSKTNRVTASLERIKRKQQLHRDTMSAGEWLEEENSGDSLAKEFKDAGIGGKSSLQADDILAKLKKKGS